MGARSTSGLWCGWSALTPPRVLALHPPDLPGALREPQVNLGNRGPSLGNRGLSGDLFPFLFALALDERPLDRFLFLLRCGFALHAGPLRKRAL